MDQVKERRPLILNPPPNVIRVNNTPAEENLLKFLQEHPEWGFDCETTVTKDFYWRRMRTMQFGDASAQYVIDLLDYCDGDSNLLYDCQGDYGKNLHLAPKLKALFEKLTPFLCSDKYLKVGVNLAFEYTTLYWNFGIRSYGYYCCMLAEKCIYAGLGGHASLKNYEFFSMEELMGRYFGVYIDKELQTSFTIDQPLSNAQLEYAALDTRTPLAIKMVQQLITSGETVNSLISKNKPHLARCLKEIDQLLLGDNLKDITLIENNAIGSFADMYVHGENFDAEKWLKRVAGEKEELKALLLKLDAWFLPIVGSKHDSTTEEEIAKLEAEWKSYNEPTIAEVQTKGEISKIKREVKKQCLFEGELVEKLAELEENLGQLSWARIIKKEELKKNCSEIKKRKTVIKNLFVKCEGEALINYGSDTQLLKILKEKYKKLEKLEGLDDEVLEEYESVPVIKLIREYHGLSKKLDTYGDAWAQTWKTHPCLDEGWLHPGDNKLHVEFNQYDADTGRSSSSKPNGQNLPQDKEVRACFIADVDDEFGPHDLITIDMSGAELRILAEEAKDPIWIKAFSKNEDVHSICTELVEGEELWHKLAEEGCAYFKLKENGEPQRKKCKCKQHNEIRNGMKSTNFGLPYGIGPRRLSKQIGKTYKETKELMTKHKEHFPYIWNYLDESGMKAKLEKKSFDLFGRRRLFPEPTWTRATEKAKEDYEKQLKLPEEDARKNVETFVNVKGRKPTAEEKWLLTHRLPNNKEVSKTYQGMFGNIERQGKNHRIQSANATIAKLAMGAGYDKNGKPFLWHIFTKYNARLRKFVHDELVIDCPSSCSKEVAELVKDAFKRAAAERMVLVEMDSEYSIGKVWSK